MKKVVNWWLTNEQKGVIAKTLIPLLLSAIAVMIIIKIKTV